MKHCIIGTAGHVDHGKTALVRALTGTDTDRLPAERERGLTIEPGYALLPFPDGSRAGIVDVPGHERFLKNMLAGAGGMDLAMLVVGADEGVMPQTAEHLAILSLLGLKGGVVVVTKADKADGDRLAVLGRELEKFVSGSFLEGQPVIATSARTGQGIEALRSALWEQAQSIRRKTDALPFRLPVDRVFSAEGFGTVVTGTLTEGAISVGEEAILYPGGKALRIRGLQVYGEEAPAAFAGQRVAANLSGLSKSQGKRGDVLAFPGSLSVFSTADVRLRVLGDSRREIRSGDRLHLFHATARRLCRCTLLDRERLGPGETGYAQLRLESPLAAKAGDPFVLRFYSPLETIGGGVILDPDPPRHKRREERVLSRLAALESGEAEAVVLHRIERAFARRLRWEEEALTLPLSREDAESALRALEAEGQILSYSPGRYLSAEQLRQLADRARSILQEYHEESPLQKGMGREELRQKLLGELPEGDVLLRRLAEEGAFTLEDGVCAARGFAPAISGEERQIRERLLTLYGEAGFSPPTREEALAGFGRDGKKAAQVLEAMVSEGALVYLTDRLLIPKALHEGTVLRLRQQFGEGQPFRLAQLRDLLGTSRKNALAYAQSLDKAKITKRVGDMRVLTPTRKPPPPTA